MRTLRAAVAAGGILVSAAVAFAVFGPGPNSVTVPSTAQLLSATITAPANNSQAPIPPGTVVVQGNCAITPPLTSCNQGTVINVLYVLDVSGSTDRDYLVQNHIPLVDANGNGIAGDAGDDFNGDGEAGDTLDGEIAGVLALHASIGNPAGVNVGVEAFASNASAADVDPATPNSGGITQFFTNPPQADRNGTNGPDIIEVLRSLDSNFNTPSGGLIGKFTVVSRSTLGSGTEFPDALTAMNNALSHFPPGKNIVFFLSDGESNAGFRCIDSTHPCKPQLDAAVAACTTVNTVGVGASADPVDLTFIANYTHGTFTQVTNPSQLSTILPLITPVGLHHAVVNGTLVPLDALGNFSRTIACPGTTPFTVTATCVASDPASTSVSADVGLSCFMLCGNGVVNPAAGEECDPPNTATCDANCQRIPLCGDGFIDAPEQCEPPNTATCNQTCRFIVCGNGNVEQGEECEPPGTAICDASCQRIPLCGDGFVDAPEQCEPPSTATCDHDCTFIVCGNGEVEQGEECEPPNTATCDGQCQRVPNCGDGFVDAPEQCEPPSTGNCDSSCRLLSCGNGVVQSGEECEPPNTTTCDASCQRVPICGDGFIDGAETCDPPHAGTCDANCQTIVCGNGLVQPGEECEPPSTATCDASCQRVPACGDGFIDGAETCDPPHTGTCDASCQTIVCGNGLVQPGEECEPPSTATCDGQCQRVPNCGDGFVDAPETCDPPNGTTCSSRCTLIVCGDLVVDAPEECDPPHLLTCDTGCQRVPVCGDGFIDAPELCDPPNGTTCGSDCRPIVCGNGIVEGLEDCEPPNTTTCDAQCHTIACSDVDSDDVCDVQDNCLNTPNPDQGDADGDGIGDACDPCTDTDGDGFGDPGFPANTCPPDNCPEDPNPNQEDLDGDGIGDICDSEDALLNVVQLKINIKAPMKGQISAKGDFVLPLALTAPIVAYFNADEGIAMRVKDSRFLDETFTWPPAECITQFRPQGPLKRIKCMSADKRFKGTFRVLGSKQPTSIQYKVKFAKLDIQTPKPFLADVTVRLKHGGQLRIDRVGAIHDCRGTGGGLRCLE